MLIRNLPDGLRQLAQNRFEQYNLRWIGACDNPGVSDLTWDRTPEGYDFWQRVNNGDYATAYGHRYGCRLINPRLKELSAQPPI